MEQRWWYSGTDMVDRRNSDSGTVERRWWNGGTDLDMVEQWNNDGGTVE